MSAQRLAVALFTAFAAILPASVQAQPVPFSERARGIDIAGYVQEASQRFGIPEHWIFAVIRFESAGQTRAVSSAGAMGLMQLMPGTWARQRARFALGSDPFDPRDNILAGTSYLREMYDRYGAEGFLAAYNAGPGRYEQWRDQRRPLPLETRRYVATIAPLLQRESMIVATTSRDCGSTGTSPPIAPNPPRVAVDPTRREPPGNPFARPRQPDHDLFASVSTSDHQRHRQSCSGVQLRRLARYGKALAKSSKREKEDCRCIWRGLGGGQGLHGGCTWRFPRSG